jgi:hypothetical protein
VVQGEKAKSGSRKSEIGNREKAKGRRRKAESGNRKWEVGSRGKAEGRSMKCEGWRMKESDRNQKKSRFLSRCTGSE